MAVLARKISRSKWEQQRGLGTEEIPAGAVTIDLKADGNSVSFWRCASSDASDLKRAVLAMAANGDKPDKYEVVGLDALWFSEAQISVRETPGVTKVASLVDHHIDAENLDIVRLANLAGLVVTALRDNSYLRMTSKEVVRLLADAIKANEIELTSLSDDMKKAVACHIAKDAL